MRRGSRRARRAAEPRPLDLARARGGQPVRVRTADGREYFVTPASPSPRGYVCPGCASAVRPGQTQVAAWEADSLLGGAAALEMRRHWHLACWRAFAA
ncbi:MAG: hypothetical protein LBG60_16330 [Bifidobacteriaceae bacterium]|jgi:hypothetical protein|nr:hypothetical protein [Bifidobacteriaceae bacterium]